MADLFGLRIEKLGLPVVGRSIFNVFINRPRFSSHQVLLKRRLPPTHGGEGGKSSGAAGSHMVLGTLSAIVGHPIHGYLPMPDWCSVQPDSSLREPPKEEPRALALAPRSGGGKSRKGESDNDFYSGSGSESESESESLSGSESESGSGSSPEYSSQDGSDSDPYDSASPSEDGSGSGSESSESGDSGSESQETSDGEESDSSTGSRSSASSSSSSSSSDSSKSSATKGEEGVGLLIMGPSSSTSAATTTTYGASAPAPHTQDLTGLVERMNVADTIDSALPHLGAAPGGELATLSTAGLRAPGVPGLGASGRAMSLGRTSSASSVMSADPEADTSGSFPSTLLRQQTSGGLKVDYRFSRARVSALSRPSTKITLRLTFNNHGETPVRRIRVVAPRDGTPMDPFPEIQMLAAGAANTANLGIDFGGKAKDVSGYIAMVKTKADGVFCSSFQTLYCIDGVLLDMTDSPTQNNVIRGLNVLLAPRSPTTTVPISHALCS